MDHFEVKTTDRHLHFITLMEDIILVLQHLFEAKATPAVSTSSRESFLDLENRFAALDVEEPSQTETTSPTESSINLALPTIELQNSRSKDDDEKIVAIYCLFGDLETLKRYVENVWSQYWRKELDLITASVITDTAFQMAIRTQNECLADYPELAEHSYLMNLFTKMCPEWTIDALWVFVPEMWTLEQYCIDSRAHGIPNRGYTALYESSTSEFGKNMRAVLCDNKI